MESYDSSPNYMRATTSFGAKKENSPGGSECDDIIAVTSSTCGSSINGPYVASIKHRTNNKKPPKNFGNVRSFRRKVKSRIFQSPVAMSNDSLVDSPHYLKATSCFESKKTRSSDDSSSVSSKTKPASKKSLQTLSRTSSLRNVRILIKKTSFKPKRGLRNYSKASEDVGVDRATYSSTLKDSKFSKPVEVQPEETELDKISALKVCRYHHCSLHGHCHGGGDDPVPPLKRFLPKKRRSLKKQKSVIPKTADKRKNNLQKSQTVPVVEPMNLERVNDRTTFSEVENEIGLKSQTVPLIEPLNQERINDRITSSEVGNENGVHFYSEIMEVMFGETSFPERSYQDNLHMLRKYDQQFGGTSFVQNSYCVNCSCQNEKSMSTPGQADANDGYENEVPQDGNFNVLERSSSALFKNPNEHVSTNVEDSLASSCTNEASNRDGPETPARSDEITKKDNAFSSASDSHTSTGSNSEDEREFSAESNPDSEVNQVAQVNDSVVNKLQFSKQRHVSMWQLIHQHMSANLAADQSTEKPLETANGENQSSTSCRELSDSDDVVALHHDSENQEIEVRKLFAIKLVREAIEKILLPEVQDQASDDRSVASETTGSPEIAEKDQSKESDANDEQGQESKVSSDPKEEIFIKDDAPGPDIKETEEKKVVKKSEKKVPKHWSNLKKWILLQRFIRELEKVRKFNLKKPNLLPLNPEPQSEKVNLRRQTVDGRKNAEEWMLDYALRQAVDQLAPTQKRKVALLVKAFETVVPTQEDPQVQVLKNLENGTKLIKKNDKLFDLNDNSGVKSKFLDVGFMQRTGDLKPQEDPLFGKSQSSSTTMTQSLILGGNGKPGAIEENLADPRVVDQEKIMANETQREADMKNEYFDDGLMQSNGNLKPQEDPESEKVQPSVLTTRSLILNEGKEKSVATENSPADPGALDQEKMTVDGTEREDDTKDGGQGMQTDRKNQFKMWHMIYQHVVSGIVEKVGSQLLDGSEDDEAEHKNSPAMNGDDCSNDLSQPPTDESSQRDQLFTKSDALKLIKEAVDEILLPEIQDDSSDTQSVTSESIADQEISLGTKQVSKNWSKLKKLILLKRSIRALEKARKVKKQPLQLSRQQIDFPEPEKVDLRKQMMDERKKAEQWMLDYAVQHIVTKLTPARKRRVSMLVEAFEAVVPLPEV